MNKHKLLPNQKTRNIYYSFLILIGFLSSVMPINAQFPTFTKIDTSIICTAGGFSNSGVFGDFNNDGLDDLIIANIEYSTDAPVSHLLFINKGDWYFKADDTSIIAGETSTNGSHGANWADYDNDGDMDLFVCILNDNNVLFENNGDGSFTLITEGSIVNDGGYSGPAAWIDLENDGYLDLYVINQTAEKNFLYHNNGDGTFTRLYGGELISFVVSADVGPYCLDIDNDGDDDVFGTSMWESNYLYLNDGDGNFTKIESGDILDNGNLSSYCGWGDYDNDSYLDVFIPTLGPGFTAEYDILYRNNGNGTFSKVQGNSLVDEKVPTDDGCWADFDNDGYLDLFTSDIERARNTLFKNNGDGSFTKIDIEAFKGVIGGHTSISDMNNDGFMDIFIARGYNNFFLPDTNVIFANDGNNNGWLTVNLIGSISNRNGFGARVKAKATIDGNPVWQVREIGVSGLAGHTHAHFGFGDATIIDSLVVEWPAGHDTVLENVAVKEILSITEKIPERYLRASFAADTTMGRGELTVNFKDISRSDSASPIISWSWDFDGDGEEDSNKQYPEEYTYLGDEEHIYDVSLTVSNGTDTSMITRKGFIQVYPDWSENLAPPGIATASSYENKNNAINANDRDLSSRWGSKHSNTTDWLMVELASVYTVDKVIIHWEQAFAKEYEIQTSLNDSDWETVYSETSSDGSMDIINFIGSCAKYVKVFCKTKVAIGDNFYGFSLYEIEIYGSDGSSCQTVDVNTQKIDKMSLSVYPNPAKEDLTFEFSLVQQANIQLTLYDLLGRKLEEVYNGSIDSGAQSITWDCEKLCGGTYFYHLNIQSNNSTQTLSGKVLLLE